MASLPNENMEFVPLDVLTAAQLNQLVANISFLLNETNGLAAGTKFTDGAIAKNKLATDAQMFGTYLQWENIAVGYGAEMKMTRLGKMVFAQMYTIINVGAPGSRSERLPDKFIPKNYGFVLFNTANNFTDKGSGSVRFLNDGRIIWNGATGHNEYLGMGFWEAKD